MANKEDQTRSPQVALTQQIDAIVDNKLTVPKVVQDGLKVFRAAVYQVGPLLIPLVAPHICEVEDSMEKPRQ